MIYLHMCKNDAISLLYCFTELLKSEHAETQFVLLSGIRLALNNYLSVLSDPSD